MSREGGFLYSKMLKKYILFKFDIEKSIEDEELTVKYLERIAQVTFENYKKLRQEFSNENKLFKALKTIISEQKAIEKVFFKKIVESKIIEILSPEHMLIGMMKFIPKTVHIQVIKVPFV